MYTFSVCFLERLSVFFSIISPFSSCFWHFGSSLSTMPVTPISSNKMLWVVERRLDSIFTWLIHARTDDISNLITSSDVPGDVLHRVYGFVGPVNAWSSSEGWFMRFFRDGSLVRFIYCVCLSRWRGKAVCAHGVMDSVFVDFDGIKRDW